MKHENDNTPKRSIGLVGLTMTGIGSVIGSGWLFGAYHAAKLAGPASIFSWILGGMAVLIVALSFIEMSSLVPKSGGPVRYLDYTHGKVVGYLIAWSTWLSIITVIPIEAEASVQYMASWQWEWAKPITENIFNLENDSLSSVGLGIAGILMIVYFLLNYWSVSFFSKCQSAITWFKIFVPFFCVLSIVLAGFHSSNFNHVNHSFIPYGWAGVLTAISTAGIIFSYNGFQIPLHFSGEAKNPKKHLALAVLLTIFIAIILYVGLQVSFLGSVEPSVLDKSGWSLNFDSPFAQIAIALNLNLVVLMLYVDAFVSPSGTGITYLGATTRMLFAMSENKHLPKFLSKLHPTLKVPRAALWVNIFIAFVFLYLFRSWGQLAGVISVLSVVTYLVGPVAAMSMRKLMPEAKRTNRIKSLNILAPLGFIVCSEILYWATWPLTGKCIFVLLFGFVIFAIYQNKNGWADIKEHLVSSLWIFGYFITMAFLSFIGSKEFNGLGYLTFGEDMVVVGIVSLCFFYWGISSAWVTPQLNKDFDQDLIINKKLHEEPDLKALNN